MRRLLKTYRPRFFPPEIKWSYRILIVLLVIGLFGKFIANDVPIIGKKDGRIYFPVFKDIANDLGIIKWKNRYTFNHLDQEYDFAIRPIIPYNSRYMDNANSGYVSPFGEQKVKSLYYRHWLGTDGLGRDVLAGLIRGTWIAVIISLFSVLLALAIGIPVGLLAGFYGNKGWSLSIIEIVVGIILSSIMIYYAFYFMHSAIDLVIMMIAFFILLKTIKWLQLKYFPQAITRTIPLDSFFNKLIEVFKSIPTLIILFLFLGVFSKSGLLSIIVVIGGITWVRISRYIRAETLAIKENDFIKSLKAMGSSDWNILVRHILPIVFPPVLVSIIFLIGSVILMEATLSFFGIGLAVEEVSWGGMLSEARRYFGAWWLALFPGLTLFMTITALSNIGQYATKRLNPRLQD